MIKQLRILVCGGHKFIDPQKVADYLVTFAPAFFDALWHKWTIVAVIEGGATGADRGGRIWATDHLKIEPLTFPADWDRYGNKAGPIRNRAMLLEGLPNVVFAFPGKNGTANTIKQTNELIRDGADIVLRRIYGDFR